MHHTFARNLFLCSLEGLHPSDAVQGFGCSQQAFCSASDVLYRRKHCWRYEASQRASRI